MAFRKYANAVIPHPIFGMREWGNFVHQMARTPHTRVASIKNGNLIQQASEILGEDFDPKHYLLSHATIVASVDVKKVPGVEIGRMKSASGEMINRRWDDYRITPETLAWINNNQDSWSRPVLLKSYQTFIGGFNFLEHLQIEAQSKGRILDAVARDIGPSVYVDILVATNRKHAQLVKDIEDKVMTTLSMGCFLAGTQVSMVDGRRLSIEEIAPGDLVLTHRGRARQVLNKQIRYYEGELCKISAAGLPSTIRATSNHGFEVARPREVCGCGCGESFASSAIKSRKLTRRFLRGHDKRIYNPNNTYSLEEARRRREERDAVASYDILKVEAGDLQAGDFLVFPSNNTEAQLPQGWTRAHVRLLGYFLAEGSFLKYKGKPVEVQFNFSLEERDTFAAETVKLLREAFPEANEPWVQDRPERNTCVVHICGTDVAQWFKTHGGEYSYKKRLSCEAVNLPSEELKHLLGTWINGDGWISQRRTAGSTTSYDLACQLHLAMARCGIRARMYCSVDHQSTEAFQIVGSGLVESRGPQTGRRPVYTLDLGQEQGDALLGSCTKVQPSKLNQIQGMGGNLFYAITSVEKEWYSGPVHNMEVDEDHTYLVEGVAVHNCTTAHTTCTKCGNVAVDENEICNHIRYEKGNTFYDEQGMPCKVAELCGHESEDPTGGVQFIEASWVKVPAFTGAVMRNILAPDVIDLDRMKKVLDSPPPQWSEDQTVKAAKLQRRAGDFDFGDFGEGDEGGEEKKEEKKDDDPLDSLEGDIEQTILDRVKKRLKDKIQSRAQEDAAKPEGELATATNQAITHDASDHSLGRLYREGVGSLVKTARDDTIFLNQMILHNTNFGIYIPKRIYKVALQAGPTAKYGSNLRRYLKVCADIHGRKLTSGEAATLIRLGHLLSLRTKIRPSTKKH